MDVKTCEVERTEEEKKQLLDKLVALDPDTEVKNQMPWNEDFFREVIGVLLADQGLATKHVRFIKPMHFVNESHQLIYRLFADHVTKYHSLPSKAWLMNEMDLALVGKPEAVRLYYKGELSTIWVYCRDTGVPEAIDAKLRRFAEVQATQVNMMILLDVLKKGTDTPEEIDQFILDMAQERRLIRQAASEDARLCTLRELFDETEAEYKWFVPNRIPAGKLMLAAGPGKKGKTTSLIHTFLDTIFTGKALGQDAERFNLLYLDFENDTAYLKNIILAPAMQGRDWQELGKWLHVSNRQVKSDHLKLRPYVTAEYIEELAGRYEGPVLVLIDSLRRAFGRTPGLKDNWEWSASVISGLLDPLGELAHKTGNTIAVIHHYNNEGRASGSTDLIAAPDVIWDFEVVRNGSGQETNDRRIKITGRVPYIEPLLLTFENNVYRYLGAGQEAITAKKEETVFVLMEKIVKALEAGPKSGVALVDELGVTNKNDVYKCLNILKDRHIVVEGGKKYHLAVDYTLAWHKLRFSLGYRDSTAGGDSGTAGPSSPSPSLASDGDNHLLSA